MEDWIEYLHISDCTKFSLTLSVFYFKTIERIGSSMRGPEWVPRGRRYPWYGSVEGSNTTGLNGQVKKKI